jgi:hypothetical protein
VHGLDHQRGRQRDPAPGSRYLELTRLPRPGDAFPYLS